MKRALKILGVVLGALVLLVAGFLAYVAKAPIPHYPVPPVTFVVDHTPERVARGGAMVRMTCAMCHFDAKTGALTGKRMEEEDPASGETWTKNITQHPEKGIGAWSDAEIAYLLRTGVRRDGQMTPPWMVKLPNMSDEDVKDIIAFLRSDDPLVQAKDVDDRESRPSVLVKALFRVAFKPLPWPAQPIAAPPAADKVAFGRYLVTGRYECYSCHAPDFMGINFREPEKTPGFLSGSNRMYDTAKRVVYSANITPDAETGIGTWTEEQLRRALKGGLRPDNTPLRYPMPNMNELTEEEVGAIYAYLRTVPAIRKQRPPSEAVPMPAGAEAGRLTYYRYSCDSCHGDTGVGLHDLRPAAKRFATDAEIVAFIKHPEASRPGIRMPTWDGVIAESELAPLAAYVRTLGQR